MLFPDLFLYYGLWRIAAKQKKMCVSVQIRLDGCLSSPCLGTLCSLFLVSYMGEFEGKMGVFFGHFYCLKNTVIISFIC
jgi:hypothetical protein